MTLQEERKNALKRLLKERAVRFGDFTLASGAKSSYYIDAKLATLIPEGYVLIGQVIADTLGNIQYGAIGGLETGAIPIACSVASARPSAIFFVRRKKKEHGTQKWIEGPLEKNQKVVIVEDVVTTGGSVIKAINRTKDFGADIVKVIVLMDRLQGAKENIIKECGSDFNYESIFTLSDLGVDT